MKKFESGELFYMTELPLASRETYKDSAVVTDELATYSYYFNTNNELFSDARVRRALSMALDRNEIVNLVVFAKAATGLVPEAAFDTKAGTSFRKNGTDLISSTADVEGAKALLREAGVRGGSFTISIRPNEMDREVAKYVKGVWESLGFTVKVKEVLPTRTDDPEKTVYKETFTEVYMSGEFDVIAADMQMLTPYAFSALAPFAQKFSGNGVNMDSETYDVYGHVSGYKSEAYDALIEEAFLAGDTAARAEALQVDAQGDGHRPGHRHQRGHEDLDGEV